VSIVLEYKDESGDVLKINGIMGDKRALVDQGRRRNPGVGAGDGLSPSLVADLSPTPTHNSGEEGRTK
jgi:hypothetical protein